MGRARIPKNFPRVALDSVLIIGSGKWANTLTERYRTLANINVSQISFQQSLLFAKGSLPPNDLFVLASRPQNNFEFLLKHENSKANFLVEKPLVFDERSRTFFSTRPPTARISVNYQYSSTPGWTEFVEICKSHLEDITAISISNLGPVARSYLSPALDYGSHVLALAIELRSILEMNYQDFQIVDCQGDELRQEIKIVLNKIELYLEFGTHEVRANRIQLRLRNHETVFDLNAKKGKSITGNTEVGSREPILRTLQSALNLANKKPIQGVQESIEIFDIYKKAINS